MAAYEVLLLNTAVPQIQAAQAGDTYVVPRDIAFSAALTLSAGTANGVPYLNGSKVLTTGSALTFDGTNLTLGTASPSGGYRFTQLVPASGTAVSAFRVTNGSDATFDVNLQTSLASIGTGVGDLAFLRQGTEQMRLTSTGLGIGTSSPGYRLDVSGGHARIRGAQALFWGNSDNTNLVSIYNGGSSGASTAQMVFETNATEKMRLDSAGNLGLGVTPSAWGSGFNAIQIKTGAGWMADGANSYFSANSYWNGTNWIRNLANAAARYQMESGAHAWFTAPSGTAGNAISFTQRMTLTEAGNLGLGQTSPTAFTNYQGITVNQTTGSFIDLQRNGTTGGRVQCDGNYPGMALFAITNDPLVFGTNNSERARITSGGIALFGKTNDYSLGTRPGVLIASSDIAVAPDNTASANNRNWAVIANGYENGSFDFVSSSANNTWANDAYRMSVTRAGSTYNTTGTYGTLTSDQRLKQDIDDASSQWNDLKAIKFRKFRMKSEVASEGDAALVRLGVIAQEVESVSPNLVTRRIANDNDVRAVPELEGQEVLGFKDSVLFWKAAVALQEAMARIETLEAEVAALKGN